MALRCRQEDAEDGGGMAHPGVLRRHDGAVPRGKPLVGRDLKEIDPAVIPEAEIPPIPLKFTAPPLANKPQPGSASVPLAAYNEPGSPGYVPGSTGSFGWPIAGRYISQYFYSYHLGIDVPGNTGDPVYSSDGGRVARAGWWPGGFGNAVKIDHGNGYVTLYAHMSAVQVVEGQRVKRGDVIGQMGSTGRSTGTHLHFEVRQGGALLNPLSFLK